MAIADKLIVKTNFYLWVNRIKEKRVTWFWPIHTNTHTHKHTHTFCWQHMATGTVNWSTKMNACSNISGNEGRQYKVNEHETEHEHTLHVWHRIRIDTFSGLTFQLVQLRKWERKKKDDNYRRKREREVKRIRKIPRKLHSTNSHIKWWWWWWWWSPWSSHTLTLTHLNTRISCQQ